MRCAKIVMQKFSRLDIAVTTPGLNIRKTILDYTEEDLDRVLNLNIKGTVWFFQAFGRIMVEQKGGSIIACSSVRAVTIEPGLGVYGSTKAAIGLLVKGFASEVGRSGVRVNAIAPSIAETALTGPFKQRPDIYNLYAGHTVFNRWSSADEVATAVAYLASDAASYVSGSTLFVDGGWTARRRAADRPHPVAQIGRPSYLAGKAHALAQLLADLRRSAARSARPPPSDVRPAWSRRPCTSSRARSPAAAILTARCRRSR